MAPFDLTKEYIDCTGDKIIVTSKETPSGTMTTFKVTHSGRKNLTYTYVNTDPEYLEYASVPTIATDEVEAIVSQLDEAREQGDEITQLYMSSLLLTMEAGLPQPTKQDWFDARSCHDSGCHTPFVLTRADPRKCVQIAIPYSLTDVQCTCCDMLQAVLKAFIGDDSLADLENSWIMTHVESGGLIGGRFNIAIPRKDLNEIELNTFLQVARHDDTDILLAHTRVKCMYGNTLLWPEDIVRKFGVVVLCSLYYSSFSKYYKSQHICC